MRPSNPSSPSSSKSQCCLLWFFLRMSDWLQSLLNPGKRCFLSHKGAHSQPYRFVLVDCSLPWSWKLYSLVKLCWPSENQLPSQELGLFRCKPTRLTQGSSNCWLNTHFLWLWRMKWNYLRPAFLCFLLDRKLRSQFCSKRWSLHKFLRMLWVWSQPRKYS